MDGTQKTAYEELLKLAKKVKDGEYGEDDGFEVEDFENDLVDILSAL